MYCLLSNCSQLTVIKTVSNYTKYTKLTLYKSQILLKTIKCSNLTNHNNRLYTIKLLLQSYTQTLQNILAKFWLYMIIQIKRVNVYNCIKHTMQLYIGKVKLILSAKFSQYCTSLCESKLFSSRWLYVAIDTYINAAPLLKRKRTLGDFSSSEVNFGYRMASIVLYWPKTCICVIHNSPLNDQWHVYPS